jgi:hypothetical protein
MQMTSRTKHTREELIVKATYLQNGCILLAALKLLV